jgi:hypothetical protein
MAKKVMPSPTMYNGVNREDVTARSDIEYLEAFYVRSVQPKLAVTSERMVGEETILDNS